MTKYDIEKLEQCADRAETFVKFMKGGNDMARPKTGKVKHALNIRLDDDLMQQIEACRAKLEADGLKLSLAAVVRHLIEKGIKNHDKNS